MNREKPSPHAIFAIGSGFMGAQLLLCAVDLDVFAALGLEGRSLAELAQEVGAAEHVLRLVLDGLVALEVLVKEEDIYKNTALTAAYLSGAPGEDLRPFLRHWHRQGYLAWSHLGDALRGRAVETGWQEGWLEASAAIAPEAARPLASSPELDGCRRVLVAFDPSGAVLSALLHAHPETHATLAESPAVHASLRERFEREGLAGRVTLLAVDPLRGPFTSGHDAAVMVHAMHWQSPERNEALLAELAQSVEPNAPLLLVDHWLNATRTQPSYAAVSSAELLLATGEGRNYGVDEAQAWLDATGFALQGHRRLVGPTRLIVARRAL